ncbi:MAG: hypothetical protein JWM27_3245 [Gemmatimonadetes bacterium]|nr:hypothetical protein [Gemmatimonadota bacterium]
MGSRDRWLLVALCVLLVLLASLGASQKKDGATDFRPSTYLTSPRGTRALYLALREVGVKTDRRTKPWDDADSLAGPLAVLAPSQAPSAGELGRLAAWVRRGGMLVYVPRPIGDPAADTLGLHLAVMTKGKGGPLAKLMPLPGGTALPLPHRWTQGSGPVAGFHYYFTGSSPALARMPGQPLLRTAGGRVTAVVYSLGKGTVLAISDAAPLGNASLRESGVAVLVARAAAEATRGGRTLRFDEFHHGFSDGAGAWGAVGHFLGGTAPGHAVLQLLAVAGGVLLLFGRRFGAALAPLPAERRSPLEHVEALAGAYRQAGARATARRLVVAGLARRMGRKPQPAGAGGDADVVQRLTARLPVAREAAAALNEEWSRGPDGDLVALARNVDRLLDEVKRP